MIQRKSFLPSLVLILLICFTSCKENANEEVKEAPEEVALIDSIDWVAFPKVSVDSLRIEDRAVRLVLTDTTDVYGPTIVDQYMTIYVWQIQANPLDIDEIRVTVQLPKREDGDISHTIGTYDFKRLNKMFRNKVEEDFIMELLELNMQATAQSEKNFLTFLDKLNMSFAQVIEANYKREFPNNSTWWGFNSFEVFRAYLEEHYLGEEDLAHQILEKLKDSPEKYISEEEERLLFELLAKYEAKVPTI